MAGKPDIRERDKEFEARGNVEVPELGQRLAATISEASGIIRNLAPGALRK